MPLRCSAVSGWFRIARTWSQYGMKEANFGRCHRQREGLRRHDRDRCGTPRSGTLGIEAALAVLLIEPPTPKTRAWVCCHWVAGSDFFEPQTMSADGEPQLAAVDAAGRVQPAPESSRQRLAAREPLSLVVHEPG